MIGENNSFGTVLASQRKGSPLEPKALTHTKPGDRADSQAKIRPAVCRGGSEQKGKNETAIPEAFGLRTLCSLQQAERQFAAY
jgi:hypothetical protein